MMLYLPSLVVLAALTAAHRYGADPQACDTMKPGHGSTVRQTRATPYIVETHNPGYVPCSTLPRANQFPNCGVMVRIRTRRGGSFKGFLIQARSKMPDGSLMYVGDFRYANGQVIPSRTGNINQFGRAQGQFGGGPVALGQVAPGFGNQFGGQQFGGQQFGNQFNPLMNRGQFQRQTTNVVVQKLNCPRGFGVTHTENNPKNYVQLIWYPPVGFKRPIQFVATVVQDFNTYWMGHRSAVMRARPRLTMSRTAAQTGRWINRYNSAPKTTFNLALVITFTSILLSYLL